MVKVGNGVDMLLMLMVLHNKNRRLGKEEKPGCYGI